MKKLLGLENISIEFDKNPVVKNISLKIEDGEVFGIVGYSGAGKSTLLRSLNLLLKPTSGKVFYNHEDVTNLKGSNLKKFRKQFGMIFQHFNLMETRTVYNNVRIAVDKKKGEKEKVVKQRIRQLLETVGLEKLANKYPQELSGGQKQRVAIARALINKPKVLLCDEPTSALDPLNTNTLLKLLKKINRELKLTIVIITHEIDVTKAICDRVSFIDNGELLALGSPSEVFINNTTSSIQKFISFNEVHARTLPYVKNKFGVHGKQIYQLIIEDENVVQPLISNIQELFSIKIIVLAGGIDVYGSSIVNNMFVIFQGDRTGVKKTLDYLLKLKVKIKQHGEDEVQE